MTTPTLGHLTLDYHYNTIDTKCYISNFKADGHLILKEFVHFTLLYIDVATMLLKWPGLFKQNLVISTGEGLCKLCSNLPS